MRVRPLTALAVGLVLVLTGCSQEADETDGTATGSVTADGARVALDGAAVEVPPGAAPDGTTLTVRAASRPPADGSPVAATATTGVAVDLGGRQPDRPIRITLPATRSPAESGPETDRPLPFVLTRPSDGTAARLVPAVFDPVGRTVTTEVVHLSDFWEQWVTPREFAQQLLHALAGGTPRPECHGRSVDGVQIRVADEQVWACVRIDDTDVVVDLTDNSPAAWLATTRPAGAVEPQGAVDLVGAVAVASGNRLYAGRSGSPAVLPVGSGLSYRFPRAALPASVALSPDPQAYLISVGALAADLAARWFEPLEQGLDPKKKADCLVDAVEVAGSEVDAAGVAAVFTAVAECGNLGGGAVTAVVTAGGLLAGGIVSIVNTAQGPLELRLVDHPTELGALTGGWTGTVVQLGNARRSYTATLNLGTGSDDGVVGVSNYPQLGCTGQLEHVSFQDGRLVVIERLTRGAGRCLDDVRLELVAAGSTLRYSATVAGGRTPVATGVLHRPGYEKAAPTAGPTAGPTARCPSAREILAAYREKPGAGEANRVGESACSGVYTRAHLFGAGLPDGVVAWFRRDGARLRLLASGTASDACAAEGAPSAAYADTVLPRTDAVALGCSLE